MLAGNIHMLHRNGHWHDPRESTVMPPQTAAMLLSRLTSDAVTSKLHNPITELTFFRVTSLEAG